MLKKCFCLIFSVLMLISILVGCGEPSIETSNDKPNTTKPGVIPTITQGEQSNHPESTATTVVPTEPTEPAFPLGMYSGELISAVYSGVSADGGTYALPNMGSEMKEAYVFNQWSKQVGLRYAYVEEGVAAVSKDYLEGFVVGDGIIYREYENGKQQEFYNLYTGALISKEDILKIYTFGTGDIWAFIKEMVTNDYMYYAYESDAYTPEGLAKTLSDEHLKTMNISLNHFGEVTCRLNFLDADGNVIHWINGQEDQSHIVLSSYRYAIPKEYRSIYKTRDGYHIDYPDGYDRVDVIAEIPDLYFKAPGAISIMNHMAEDVGRIYSENDNNIHYMQHQMIMAGQYLFIKLEVYPDNDSYQTFTYILDLLDGEEKTPEEIYVTTFWDSSAMMDMLKAKVDENYRWECERITGKPFAWGHDEELYQKTLSDENLLKCTVLPSYNGMIACINGYFPGSEQPVTMDVELCLTPRYYESEQEYVDLLVLKNYPGLEEWIEGYNGERAIASYLNYGVWEFYDYLIVGIGWFDEDGQWAGYEAAGIHTTTGMMCEWEQTLLMAGTTKETFENELRTYLEALRAEA